MRSTTSAPPRYPADPTSELWTSDQMDPATLSVFYSCLVVLIVAAVIPWRYVVAHYVTKQGDPWRKTPG